MFSMLAFTHSKCVVGKYSMVEVWVNMEEIKDDYELEKKLKSK